MGTVLAFVASIVLPSVASAEEEIRIEISRKGELFVVHAFLFAPVPPRDAWVVLTDFENMTAFVPNLSESRVMNRSGDRLTVAQKGVARFGVLAYPFESVREVELFPFEAVRSRNVGGNVSRVDSTTRLVAFERGTRISYYVEVEPGFWFPGFVGEAFLKHEIREQFEAIVREMVRRRQVGAPVSERTAQRGRCAHDRSTSADALLESHPPRWRGDDVQAPSRSVGASFVV